MFKKMVSVFLMVVMVGTMAAGCPGEKMIQAVKKKNQKN